MSRVRQTLEQKAGHQLPQGTGVHAGGNEMAGGKKMKGRKMKGGMGRTMKRNGMTGKSSMRRSARRR